MEFTERIDNELITDSTTLEEDLENIIDTEETNESELESPSSDTPFKMNDALSDYMHMIGEYPVLSKEEEYELFTILRDDASSKEDKEKARERLYLCNLKLAVYVAKRFCSKNPAIDFIDIIQDGNVGISRAIDLFDPSRGYKFSTYAITWIRQSISRSLMNTNHFIRIPVHEIEILTKIEKARTKYRANNLGNNPSYDELLKMTGYTKYELDCALAAEQNLDVTSLQVTVGEDDNTFLMELIEDKNSEDPTTQIMLDDFRKTVEEILNNTDRLSQRDKEIFFLRFGWNNSEPKTLEEVGLMYGITRERVRQIETKVFRVLHRPKNIAKLKDYKDLL